MYAVNRTDTVSPFWEYIPERTKGTVRAYHLNIEMIKKAMDIMYSHSILYRSNYVHSISIVSELKGYITFYFTNTKEELQEFVNWINKRIQSGEWFIKDKDFLRQDVGNTKTFSTEGFFWETLNNKLNSIHVTR